MLKLLSVLTPAEDTRPAVLPRGAPGGSPRPPCTRRCSAHHGEQALGSATEGTVLQTECFFLLRLFCLVEEIVTQFQMSHFYLSLGFP